MVGPSLVEEPLGGHRRKDQGTSNEVVGHKARCCLIDHEALPEAATFDGAMGSSIEERETCGHQQGRVTAGEETHNAERWQVIVGAAEALQVPWESDLERYGH